MSEAAPSPLLAPWRIRRTSGTPPLLALGTMNFGKRTPAADAERIIARAVDRGITLFDTANAYCDGESERILGRAIARRRDDLLIATKVGFGRVGGNPEGLAPARIREALDASLGRLGTDHVDLYYLHVPDHEVPIESTLEAIQAALAAGKIRSFGVSNYASWQILEIFHACDRLGMPRPIIAQQLYNVLLRQLDLEYFRFARKYGLHTTVYNPLAGGLLTGRYGADASIEAGSRFDKNKLYQSRYWSKPMLTVASELGAVAREAELTMVELSYAWLAHQGEVDSVLLGPATIAHLDQAIDSVGKSLSPEVIAKVDSIHRAFVGTETSYAR